MATANAFTGSSGGENPAINPRNPHGKGDPYDQSLRKVEIDVLIPKIMRDRAKTVHCKEQVKAFEECCKDSGFMMVMSCRPQNSALKDCLSKWYHSEDFREECKNIYLRNRTQYRLTGVPNKDIS